MPLDTFEKCSSVKSKVVLPGCSPLHWKVLGGFVLWVLMPPVPMQTYCPQTRFPADMTTGFHCLLLINSQSSKHEAKDSILTRETSLSQDTGLEAADSSVSDDALVNVVGHEELNSSASVSSFPSSRSSATGSAAPSPFILQEILVF